MAVDLAELRARVERWIEEDPDPVTQAELRALLASSDVASTDLADRFDGEHLHVLLGDLQDVLPWSVALHLGGRGMRAQVLEGKSIGAAVRKAHLEHARATAEPELGGRDRGRFRRRAHRM